MKARKTDSERNSRENTNVYSWYVLAVLFFVYLSNHIDRQILMILLEPIKQEFRASDFEMGLLTGPLPDLGLLRTGAARSGHGHLRGGNAGGRGGGVAPPPGRSSHSWATRSFS